MTVFSAISSGAANAPTSASTGKGMGGLGQTDFLRLMLEQMKMQDPTDPVDNKEMLAQMAQFSQLSGINEMGETLKTIATKLDAITKAQATGTGTPAGSATDTQPTDGAAA